MNISLTLNIIIMKKKILLTVLLISFISIVFAQNNLKVIEYKIIKFETPDKSTKSTEYVVPQGQVWKIVSMISLRDVKVEITIDGEEYSFLYRAEIQGVTDGLLPFYLPENTTFSLGQIRDVRAALNIEVLKIE
jgi:hypothetical protein